VVEGMFVSQLVCSNEACGSWLLAVDQMVEKSSGSRVEGLSVRGFKGPEVLRSCVLVPLVPLVDFVRFGKYYIVNSMTFGA
jgi:hypothetical protein